MSLMRGKNFLMGRKTFSHRSTPCTRPKLPKPGMAVVALLLLVCGLLLPDQFNAEERGAVARAAELHQVEAFRPRVDARTGMKAETSDVVRSEAKVREINVVARFNPFMDDSLLVTPDTRPSLAITESYPRLDGSTSFLPVYAAAFKALYTPPPPEAGEAAIMTYKTSIKCSSSRGFRSFLQGESDIFFGFEPADEFKRQAAELGVGLRLIPLGEEAFVFFVNEGTSVTGLTVEQVRSIYSGAVTNWKELGGPGKDILPYQRTDHSGSQTAMERHVMKGTPLMKRSPMAITMLDILDRVAQGDYADTASIGYSFRWYATAMSGVKGIRLLTLNGVPPDAASIRSERYPLTLPFYAIVREGELSSETRALLNWFSGPEGQALTEKAGYVPNSTGQNTPVAAGKPDHAAEAVPHGFNRAMISLYDAPEPLVRVLAYTNTMQLPRNAVLEKEIRERLPRVVSKIEQYIILYALASLTRSEADFDAMMSHAFRYGYVIGYAPYVEQAVSSMFLFTELYPWMAHNNIYKREAWFCGIICVEGIVATLSSEARAWYTGKFPGDLIFPETYGSPDEQAAAYRLVGLSKSEIAWLMPDGVLAQAEGEWLDSCVNMPYREKTSYNEAWFTTFDAFLPVADLGGKDAEWVRLVVAPAFELSHPGEEYSRLLGE